MARTAGALKPESFKPVVEYVRAAALKQADIFKPGATPATRLAALERELAATPAEYRHQALGDWVARSLTPEGRTRMLATLRRRRADAKGKPKAVNLRVPREDAAELQRLAKRIDMPATLALRTLVAIAAADKDLRGQMVKLAVALTAGGPRSHEPGTSQP